MLMRLGEVERAREIFRTIIRSVDKGNRAYRRDQRDWHEVAPQNLA